MGERFYDTIVTTKIKDSLIHTLCKVAEDTKKGYKVYPKSKDLFNAFHLIGDPKKVKVVIVGQDPYHTPGIADGLAFSSNKLDYIPPSLRVIFKEIYGNDYKKQNPSLRRWAVQGVLLLNTMLTVRGRHSDGTGGPGSHKEYGWENFTREVLRVLDNLQEDGQRIAFLSWGKKAQETVNNSCLPFGKNLFLDAPHPAAEKYGKAKFVGCGHFKKVNDFLIKNNIKPISW